MCLVDIASGRLTLEKIDARLDGPLPLELFRYYRSTNLRAGDLGFGWSHAFGYRLWREDDVTLGFLGGDGRRLFVPMPGYGEVRRLPSEGFEVEHIGPGDPAIEALRTRLPGGALVVRRLGLTTLVFDSGRLQWSALMHASGVLTQVHAGRDGLPARLVDPCGRVLELDRRSDGMLMGVSLRDPSGESVLLARYAYDTARDLIAVKTPAGIQRFEYDASHRLIAHWNEAGEPCRSEFDETGRCIRTSGAELVHERRYLYDDLRRVTIVADGRGAEWNCLYNDAEQLLIDTDPLGHRSSFDYDGDGRLVRATDQAGFESTILFDDAGRPAGKVGPDGAVWQVSDRKSAITLTSPCGAKTVYSFRDDGLISALSRNGRAPSSFDYGDDGRVGVVTLGSGKKVRLRWSPDGRLLEESDDDGALAAYRFDSFGHLVQLSFAGGADTRFEYDAAGHLARIDHPDRTSRRFKRDAQGRIIRLVDEAANVTRWEIDTAGRRVACHAANGDVYRVAFDQDNRMVGILMPGGLQHRYQYDLRGKVTTQWFADGRVERYEWDPRGLPVAILDASGPVIRAVYDACSRPVAFDYADATRKEVDYDADGRWLQVRHAGHSRRRELTANGDPIVEWQDELVLVREFDDLGQCVAVSDRLGQRVEYAHDADGRVECVTVGTTRSHHFNYDRRGNRIRWQVSTGTTETRTFDLRDRLTLQHIESNGRMVVERRYRYDPLGHLIEMTDSRRGRFEYRYDAIGRLVAAVHDGTMESFGWTATGTVILPASGYRAGHLIQGARGWMLDYDARGFVAARRSRSRHDAFEYSSNGLLRGIVGTDGSHHSFSYDGHSRLLGWASRTDSRRFLWDREQLWAYFDTNGSERTTWFVQVADERQPIEQTDGTSAFTVHSDHNGRACELIDSSGVVVWENTAGVWGEGAAAVSSRIECLLGLPGQLHHADSGLLYNRHRWYFPETAHYLTPDPSGIWGGLDGYAYTFDPVNRNDPLGLQCRGKTDDPILFRADRRPPEQICNEGFQQWNPAGTASLGQHVNGSNNQTPWVSTTYNKNSAIQAKKFGSYHDDDINQNYPGRAGAWIFTIRNPGCGVEVDCDPDVIAHAAQFGETASEQEIAFRKPIPPGNIVGAVNVDTGESFMCGP